MPYISQISIDAIILLTQYYLTQIIIMIIPSNFQRNGNFRLSISALALADATLFKQTTCNEVNNAK